ncbi:uncharacterized protein LOC132748349 [Ruditapes philippinarum]|uniref:uncharacterized protein LOC132748349 n=1 Tax=Ruditapes philippinarum TaxID=129788 RepID=UPI00295BBBF5|nr:uncharacterized protein LOC132748349 [Ruditapes philippinarum]
MSDEGDKQSVRPRKQRHAFYKVSTGLSVEKVMEELGISEPIRETLGKLLSQLASNSVLCKTYADVSTQTSFDDMPGEIDAVESSVERDTDETDVKVPYEDCNVIDEKNIDKESPYDNVAFKTPMNTDYGNYSLQIRERLITEETRRQSAVEVNTGKYDERECLANAIQFHIEDLIDGVIFRDSELPDCLLADGCLTEDECSSVRRIRDRKDQIRILVSLINGRDVYVLRGFLKRIKGHNQHVAVKIQEKFEDNKRKGLGQKLCFLCQLKNNFNVKHIADSLWAIQVIDKGVYNTIIFSDLPTGAQETLWCKVFHSLNYLDHQQAELAHQTIMKALTRQNLFTYLADGINDMLMKNHGRLSCSCEQNSLLRRRHNFLAESTSDESFLPRSSSDGTPNDIASTYSTDDRTIPKTVYRKPDNVTEERPLFPTSLLQSANKQHDVGDSIPESVTDESLLEFNSQTFPKTRNLTDFSPQSN